MLPMILLVMGALSDDPIFMEGCKFYDELEYEQAVFRFQELALRGDLPATDAATALAWLGLSYAGTGNMPAARRAFVDAVRRDPQVAIPVEVSPSLAQVFEEARAEAPKLPEPREAAPVSPPPTQPETSINLLPALGVAGGAVVVIAGVATAGVSTVTWAGAQDKQLFQSEARSQIETANAQLAVAWVLVPAGLAVVGVSTLFLLGGDP